MCIYTEYNEYVTKASLYANRSFSFFISREDAIQTGWVAFLESKDRWKNDKDAALETYASHRIRGAIKDIARKTGYKNEYGEWLSEIRYGFLEESNYSPIVEDNFTEENEFEKLLKPITNEVQRFILTMHYKCDMELNQIAKIMDLSAATVFYHFNNAIKELKKSYNNKAW